MSLREVRDGRAFMLRLVLAELLAKPGQGPLAPRFTPLAKPSASAAVKREKRSDQK